MYIPTGLTLRIICNELSIIHHKWFRFGIQLGIPYHALKQFEGEGDPLTATVDYWLKGNVPESVVRVPWNTIVSALMSIDERGLAHRISKKYRVQGTGEQAKKGQNKPYFSHGQPLVQKPEYL